MNIGIPSTEAVNASRFAVNLFSVPVLYQLIVEVQRDRVQIDLCVLWTRNHESPPVLVFGTQGGIKGALLGYMSH